MKILFLDDMVVRHNYFTDFIKKQRFNEENYPEIYHAYTYDQSIISLCSDNIFDLVSLDHDLSEEDIMCDPKSVRSKTGSDVATFITLMPKHKVPKNIIIHSLNPKGSENMYDILGYAGISSYRIPFGYSYSLNFPVSSSEEI
jgi:hypothetical protein